MIKVQSKCRREFRVNSNTAYNNNNNVNGYFRHKVHMLHIEKHIQCYILNYLTELKKQ